MALKLTLSVSSKIIEGTATERADLPIALEDTTITETNGYNRIKVAAGAVDTPIDLGDVTSVENLVVAFDGPLTIRVNGIGAPQLVYSKAGCLVSFGAPITSLHVSNPGTAAVNLDFTITD